MRGSLSVTDVARHGLSYILYGFYSRESEETVPFYRAMHSSAYARSWDRMSSVRLSVSL